MYEERARPILDSLLEVVDWPDAPLDRLEILDTGLALATDWPVTANAVAALAAVGLAASALHETWTGERRPVRIDTRAAGLAMASSSFLQIDGRSAKFRDPFTGFYEAAGGEWVFLHGNFPHLQAGLIDLLGASGADDVARAVRGRDASGIEDEAIAAGLCAARVRTREEWEAEDHARALRPLPVLGIERIGDAAPRPRGAGDEPLSGYRMLDLSRVIAGPMAGRTMAEAGADVLLVSGPGLPSITSLVVDTGFGKRAAEIDLRSDAGRALVRQLAAEADVMLDAYRPGALEGFGLGREAMMSISPGLVHVDLDAFGPVGPWAGRRGYDSLVQATTGMCRGGREVPANLPCQPLDYLSGYLAAFGAMLALLRQSKEGGSWSVRLSLAGTAQWMRQTHDRLGPETSRPEHGPGIAEIADLLQDTDTEFGRVRALRPPLQGPDWRWTSPPVPLGTNAPEWG
ncbi:CoA transferase [Roseicyclus sp. F158]|uniref:CoA transferase n=1 Tax=Tropicimonas omnivorans TaxID=3075590 RepID=A0ABU3DJE7_9RHOB|nr:CoA transferase [Roseicyclus sp. F158]MDT0683654.1 CoA transferase [Roseicyclus sp. F158]